VIRTYGISYACIKVFSTSIFAHFLKDIGIHFRLWRFGNDVSDFAEIILEIRTEGCFLQQRIIFLIGKVNTVCGLAFFLYYIFGTYQY
jgi:hypothetical protein